MASGWTNKGKFYVFNQFFRDATEPTNLYVALVTSAVVPSATTNTLSDLVEIAAGNGYTSGGFQLARNSTDFDVLTEDDINHRVVVQIKDVTWTASGGPIPASGNPARYAVLTDDNPTVANRLVLAWFDLLSNQSVADTQTLTLRDLTLRGLHV